MDDLLSDKFTIRGGFEDAKVYTKDLWTAMDELLEHNRKEGNHLQFKFQEGKSPDEEGARMYKEVTQCRWMEEQQEQLGLDANILIVIPASDETHVTGGGRKVHPLYVANGNVSIDQRQEKAQKRLIGFLPIVVAIGKKNADHPSVKKARLVIHNRAVAIILRELKVRENRGVLTYPDGVTPVSLHS
jgi:hypothetical protein